MWDKIAETNESVVGAADTTAIGRKPECRARIRNRERLSDSKLNLSEGRILYWPFRRRSSCLFETKYVDVHNLMVTFVC